MLTILYFIFVGVLAYFTWQALGQKRTSYTWLLLIVLFGLIYDNLMIAIGNFIGEGALLKNLNAGRFFIHALITPTMMIFGFGVLRKAGVKWAQGKTAHIVVCAFATLLIALGAFSDIIKLDLQPSEVMGTLRYANEGGIKGPPIPAILTIIFLIVAGISLWRNTGWKWLALGALFMFIAAAMGMGDMVFISNLGEVVLGAANVLTAKKFLST
ncbi:MAG: hypothetical protein KF758_14805 [Anaerolineales bacterium]|nr:hypothetical protein [Anaerolineales bacterium]MBX3038179.1 hypothetical protein [Anaerolineales bacterium]